MSEEQINESVPGVTTILSRQMCEDIYPLGAVIGDNVCISEEMLFRGPILIKPNTVFSHSSLDAYSYLGQDCFACTSTIGRYTSIAGNVKMGLGRHNISAATTSIAFYNNRYFLDFSGPISEVPEYKRQRGGLETDVINVGHDIWIGENVTIVGDVTIGSGSIIGAGTIVTKDIPPYSKVVNRNGHGEVIGQRFSDEICADLLALNWWNYDLPSVVSAVEVVLREATGNPIYEPNTVQYTKAQSLDPEKRAQYDQEIKVSAFKTIMDVFDFTTSKVGELPNYIIPYEDPQAFIAYFKNHDITKFPLITDKPFLHFIPLNADDAIINKQYIDAPITT